MFKELSQSIRDYAKKQSTGSMKQYYNDIADALDDEEFLQTLSNTEIKRKLENLQGNNFNYYINNNYGYDDALNIVHTNYVAHRADSKRTIGKFSQKIRDFEEKLQKSEEKIDEIRRVADILSGAEMLEAYANDFNWQSKKHESKAKEWLNYLIYSIIGMVVIVALLLFVQISDFPIIKEWLADDIKKAAADNLKTLVFIIKGSIIIAYIQIPLFIRKNTLQKNT
jgi:hypothetical protein